jgi:hypothetical protein
MSKQLKDLLIGLATIVSECVVGVALGELVWRVWRWLPILAA